MPRRYNSPTRERQKAISDLLRQQADVERRELAEKNKKEGRPRSERRRIAREKLLPDNRICPACNECVLESNKWAVVDCVATCLSCYRERKKKEGRP
jgi:hypothetical protein